MTDDKAKAALDGYLETVVTVATTLRRMLHREPGVDPVFLRRVLGVIVRRHDTETSLQIRGLLTVWLMTASPDARAAAIVQLRALVGPKEAKR
jgi:hypothetical protein